MGPMEVHHCEGRHTRVPLGIRRRTINDSPDISLSKVKDVLAELYGAPSGGNLGVNKNPN
jgi:hypothetical protein